MKTPAFWQPVLTRQPAREEQKSEEQLGFGKRLSSSVQHVQFSKQFCATCSWLHAVYATCSCRPAVLHLTCLSAYASLLCASRSARSVAHTRSRLSIGGGGTPGAFAFGRPLAHIVPAAGLGRMLQDAAPADRWTAKLLAYPCFDDGFRQAVLSTRLANLQFVLSVEADASGQFADQVFQWTASSAKDVHELLLSRAPMLEQFWLFARAAEAVFTDSLAYQMGFARCSKIPRERSASSIAQFQRDLAIRALAAPVLAPKSLKRLQPSAESSSATPLLDMENAEKQRWAKRLRALAERAGVHGDPDRSTSSDGILSAEEKARLQLLVFTSGAPSTMAITFGGSRSSNVGHMGQASTSIRSPTTRSLSMQWTSTLATAVLLCSLHYGQQFAGSLFGSTSRTHRSTRQP